MQLMQFKQPAQFSTQQKPLLAMPPDHNEKRNKNNDNNVLPLINVVFLLLIFFMIAGQLIPEPPFNLDAPRSSHADTQHPEANYLAVNAHGEFAWAGERIEREALAARLQARDEPKGTLQVRVDRALPAQALSELLAQLREAGVPSIQLLTLHQP